MTVYLVGAGPGDPGLLTLRAADILGRADAVLYDRLVDDSILDMVQKDAHMVYVGRAVGDDTRHQNYTNDMMLECSQKYDVVVRLKGGDPIIFGRGGEEAMFLKSHDIPYEIIPGIPSGLGSAAYTGIPLTYRGRSSSVAFVTGHEDPTKHMASVNWERLAGAVDTIVVMMGLSRIDEICEGLRSGGMDVETPVTVVRYGTTPRQDSVTGTIHNISDKVRERKMRPPANIIIGMVAGLSAELAWR